MRFALAFCLVHAAACGESTEIEDDASVDPTDDASIVVDDDGGPVVEVDLGVDAGPEPCDTPGTTETQACGLCGTVERFCSAEGIWVYGVCEGESGECTPGELGTEECGNCGTQASRCNASCMWESTGACEDEGVCAPGERTRSGEGCEAGANREVLCSDMCVFEPTEECSSDPCDTPGAIENVDCGMCGTSERFCSADGAWEYGACTGEGVCVPGSTDAIACGMCGEQTARCNTSCNWVPSGACMDEGTCAPGDRRRISAGCPAGETRLMECGATCGFTLEVEGCTARRAVDVIFLLETTGSNADALTNDLPIMATRCLRPLLAISEVRVGVAYSGEFPIGTYGSPGDRPFEGGIEPVSSATAVTDEWAARPDFAGLDASDSLVEALWSLTGGQLAASSLAMTCSSGRVAGGCWRGSAERVIVAHTDSTIHNGPNPAGAGLYQPYMGITPAPATWPSTRTRLQSDGTMLFFLDDSDMLTSSQQFDAMLSDLGQPASDRVDIGGGVGPACDALVARVSTLVGL